MPFAQNANCVKILMSQFTYLKSHYELHPPLTLDEIDYILFYIENSLPIVQRGPDDYNWINFIKGKLFSYRDTAFYLLGGAEDVRNETES